MVAGRKMVRGGKDKIWQKQAQVLSIIKSFHINIDFTLRNPPPP
jgi:hypothetical protein